MVLIPADKNELERVKRPYGNNYEVLMKFRDSDLECVKLLGWTHKHAKSCAWSMTESARRFKMFNIRVIMRGGEVYLLKV